MDLRQIQYFVALYEEGSVTRAARRLHVVQPALSMQLAKMEAELGHKLFERSAQGMVPTAAARTMYQLYLPILRDLSSARQQLDSLAGQVAGQVSVGIIVSVTQRVLLRTIEEFIARYPAVKLTVSEGYTVTLMDWVLAGQLDFAIVNRPTGKLTLASGPILTDEFVLATGTAAKTRLPARVRFKELARQKLVLPSRRHSLRAILEDHAEAQGLMLDPQLELDSITGITEIVARGDFATVLPSTTIANSLGAGALRAHRIVSPRVVRDLIYVHHPRRPLSLAAGMLKDALSSTLAKGQPRPK